MTMNIHQLRTMTCEEIQRYEIPARDFPATEPVVALSAVLAIIDNDVLNQAEAAKDAADGARRRMFDLVERMIIKEGAENTIGAHRHRFIQEYFEHLDEHKLVDSDSVFDAYFNKINKIKEKVEEKSKEKDNYLSLPKRG